MTDQRNFQYRLQMLDRERFRVEQQLALAREVKAPQSVVLYLIKERAYIQGRVDECRDWLEVQDQRDPEYGKLHRVEGLLVPRLPTFGSKEKVEVALATREGAAQWTREEILRAREARAGIDAREQALLMDGRSPYIPPEERGPMKATL